MKRIYAVPPPAPQSRAATSLGKAPTGIIGVDEGTLGGLPRGRMTIVFGGPGAGKTVFGLQNLVYGATRANEPGIFVAFEEPSAQIISNAASFDWNLHKLRKQNIFFVDATLDPDIVRAGNFELSALLASLGARAREIRAKRIIFDGIDVLLTLLDDPATEQRELYRINKWVKENNLSAILTAKGDGSDPFSTKRYSYAAYLADCALILSRRHMNVVSERELAIIKYRGSGFAENKLPFVIGSSGIEVAEQHPQAQLAASNHRVSTGVVPLDNMLMGGYYRGSSSLISGLPGTTKSSLCAAFLYAACRKERSLYISFDERSEESIRNFASIGYRLTGFIASGRLKMRSLLSTSDSAEVQLLKIRALIREFRPTCVAIDPISALAKSSDVQTARDGLARFIHWVKAQGITLLATSLLATSDPHAEATQLGISTLADTWIHLTYAARAGERNRALTIIKSRGTKHSNQVRELLVGKTGFSLADVYSANGDVLMGTLRWEQENRQCDEEERLKQDLRRRRLEIANAQASLRAKNEAIKAELAIKDAELSEAKFDERVIGERLSMRRASLRMHRRDGDKPHARPSKSIGRRR